MTWYSRFLYLIATMCCLVACSEKEDSSESSMYGVVNGLVRSTLGGQGFKVTLADPNGIQPMQIAVTEPDGTFYFSEVYAGKYTINIYKEGFECGWMLVDGERAYNNQLITINENKTTEIVVQMQSSLSTDNELTITDINGNPIGNQITIPKYTTTIAIKLFNETSQNVIWDLRQNCFISGYRDTIVGNTIGYTYHTFDVFSSISPTDGTLPPGGITIITGILNPDIYTLDRYSNHITEMYLTTYSSIHEMSKIIKLYFPFMSK